MNRHLFALLILCIITAGCTSPRYYKVVNTDPQGKLVAAWVSEGRIKRSDGAYVFKAVERSIPYPARQWHFPLGLRTRVASANTIYYPTEKPMWLEDVTPLTVADDAESR